MSELRKRLRTDEEVDEQLRLYAAEQALNVTRNGVWWARVDALLDERLAFEAFRRKLAMSTAIECARQRVKPTSGKDEPDGPTAGSA